MPLSLCMIVKDEAFFLHDCLAAAAPHVDDLVVVDTGSTDDSKGIAAEFTDRVFDYTWHDDYAAARNYSLEQARCDWILVLDADELVTPDDFAALRRLTESTTQDGFFLQQRNYNNDQSAFGWQPAQDLTLSRGFTGFTVNPILRLFRNQPDIRYAGSIHETVDAAIAEDRQGTLDTPIHHYIDANPARPRSARSLRYLELMERELAAAPSGRLYSIAATSAMYHANDFARARDYFIRAAEMGYRPGHSLEGAAEACYRAQDFGAANDLYQRADAAGHRTPSMCLNRANLAVKAGDHQRAAALLQTCLDLGGLSAEINAVIQRNIEGLQAHSGKHSA
ncbi:MAG: glycosyltransferase [Halieaceae bacterium]|uniref:glycosyltransferase family 2 protein n=1 Tax=Haliea alexandrii TaxID=2448162 RepID=UPI000F0BB16C|nr:glycosyltransferase family 2 protein [Haliea alexandrii]MCR9185117.1 glycosyltransferase [Halieaceae bacterium]